MKAKTGNPILKALIVDDEFRARASLRLLLERHLPHVEIVGEAETVREAVRLAETLQPDFVLLDIELPDGSAFDFMELVHPDRLRVIIVSAHPEHSVKAFKYATVHYLLKPVELSDLRAAVARVQDMQAVKPEPHPQDADRIALPTLEGFRMAALADIVFLEADSNYTHFYFADGSSFLVSTTLGHYEEMLPAHQFCRVHNKFIINMQHIISYQRGRGGFVEMRTGQQVEVSARKKDEFLARLMAHTRGI